MLQGLVLNWGWKEPVEPVVANHLKEMVYVWPIWSLAQRFCKEEATSVYKYLTSLALLLPVTVAGTDVPLTRLAPDIVKLALNWSNFPAVAVSASVFV